VIQPDNAWSAIVQGAVLSMMPNEATIVSSVATKHYGISVRGSYDESVDAGPLIPFPIVTGAFIS
jgi:hypothetical protein